MRTIKKAIISVSKKDGIVEFARSLVDLDVEILSTGGTAKLLKDSEVPVTLISDYTGYPEILGGRVKTLNPMIHGGILGITSNSEHVRQMKENKINPIDLIVVNLYPFEETISKPNVTFAEAIENIDIGGPTMLRSAAKNSNEVTVVVDPLDYEKVILQMKKNNKQVSLETRLNLAYKVFSHTSRYDSLIANYLENALTDKKDNYESVKNLRFELIQNLRYGENPHQTAGFYKNISAKKTGVAAAKQLHGKELSFNNIIDIDAALQIANDFKGTTAVIIKHTNPCGVASCESLLEAYKNAKATDPISAFGGIIGVNRKVDNATAKEIVTSFVEAIIAPDYEEDALETLKTKKNLRILKAPETIHTKIDFDIKKVSGGILIQDLDSIDLIEENLKIPSKRSPTDKEWEGLRFSWTVGKHVKSNAIIYARGFETVGVGAGQMSRVDSSKIAISKAKKEVKGTVMSSDAFFPFRDAIDAAAEAGITAIIQPGGSIRDEEVIAAADEHNIAMVFTGIRHFKH